MKLFDFLKKQILGITGLNKTDGTPDDDRLVFINDEDELVRMRIKEYDLWYYGESDELLNYYTYENMVDYAYNPIYNRNKRNYFWAISSTETDIKRTHSGQPRNMVDTLVNITPFPQINAGIAGEEGENPTDETLKRIIKENNLKFLYSGRQLPLTLVEGWGCYKLCFDTDFSDLPQIVYYRADNVRFVKKFEKITAIIFYDYYTGEDGKRYLKVETRKLVKRDLVITNQIFRIDGDKDYLVDASFSDVPELADTPEKTVIENLGMLWAVPTIIFENTGKTGGPGRSIFTGKIDLFDDLDQCLSQASNAVRRSTPIEYFDANYLERDENTGMPIQPTAYDRKYTMYRSKPDANGSFANSDPVKVTQPDLKFEQYSAQAIEILKQIINGVLAPATFGIDIARKDNAEAQREKEKVTIFTRNAICAAMEEIFYSLSTQSLACEEFIRTGVVTKFDYNISVTFSEFADESYENKLAVLGKAYDSQIISPHIFLNKLYNGTLSKADYKNELEFLKKQHDEPIAMGKAGMAGGGANTEGMIPSYDDDEEEI